MRFYKVLFCFVCCTILLTSACGKKNPGQHLDSSIYSCIDERIEWRDLSSIDASESAGGSSELFEFVDVQGNWHEVELQESVERNSYDIGLISSVDNYPYYEDDNYTSRIGVDVSYYQGDIDWNRVKDAGISYAFVRLGYRGYSEEGNLHVDENALTNIMGAKEAGLDVGCYFFSQAVNEGEAVEEAEFVLELLDGIELELPVVYDPERIPADEARTDDLTGEQITNNTLAFTNVIKDAGYDTAVYSNMYWEIFYFDMSQLNNIEIWYADYVSVPQTPYHFSFWQYTDSAYINGIGTTVDLNMQFIKK